MNDSRRIEPATKLHGTVTVPGDKSASHRALMISALANGTSEIIGLSSGDDVKCTSTMLEAMGAVRENKDGSVFITGPVDGLRASESDLGRNRKWRSRCAHACRRRFTFKASNGPHCRTP